MQKRKFERARGRARALLSVGRARETPYGDDINRSDGRIFAEHVARGEYAAQVVVVLAGGNL